MFSRMKLATKIAVVITALLTVIFTILIGFTLISTGATITAGTAAEFNTMAESNSLQVQQIIDATDHATKNIQGYLSKAYKDMEQSAAKEPSVAEEQADVQADAIVDTAGQGQTAQPVAVQEKHISSIYQKEISETASDVEKYISEMARNTAVHNPDIVGVGVMFEPYALDKNIASYALYVAQDDEDTQIVPFGEYSDYSQELYYIRAKEERRTVFTNPYEFNGIMMISASTPIIYNNEVKGVIMMDINVTNFNKIQVENERYPSMYATIYNQAGDIIYDSESIENVGKNMSEFYVDQEELSLVTQAFGQAEAFEIETSLTDGRKVTRFFDPIQAGGEHWWAMTAVESADMDRALLNSIFWLLVISVVALVLIVITVISTLKKMLHPIQTVVTAAKEIARGNFEINLQTTSQDEIGELTKTFDSTAKTLKTVIGDISNVLNHIANKDLNIAPSVEYVGELSEIQVAMDNIINNMNHIMTEINQSSDQVSSGSDQVSGGAQLLSQGATEQASSIEELSATISEISEHIKHNAENAKDARAEAAKAGEEIAHSNQQMQEMIVAITEISNKSNEIGKIIKTIEDIAFQTNILALNAAVEAARAGTAGKGFAVVADEVRNLASKSAQAAQNTTTLIGETVLAVENGTGIADKTAASMGAVVTSAEHVITLVDRIAEQSSEQAASILQVTQGVEQISSVVQTNSATAEESAAASEELSGQAQMLKQLVGAFHLKREGEIVSQMSDTFSTDVTYEGSSHTLSAGKYD